MANKEYVTIENNSKVYFNGSIWNSNNCGKFKIIGKTDRHILSKSGYKERKYYLCQFEDGTVVEAKSYEIKNGKVRNPNCPSICGRGFLGVGKWRFYVDQKATKEYVVFRGILNRCYNPNIPEYKEYGGEGVTLDERLFNFQEFCEMLTRIPNYDKWKNDTTGYWEIDKDFLCAKYGISPKIYSEKTCQFIPRYLNTAERNKRVSITGEVYVGISPSGEEIFFKNIKEFSRNYNLCDTHVGRCIRGLTKTHKGWKFMTMAKKDDEAMENMSKEELQKLLDELE